MHISKKSRTFAPSKTSGGMIATTYGWYFLYPDTYQFILFIAGRDRRSRNARGSFHQKYFDTPIPAFLLSKTSVMESIQVNGKYLSAAKLSQVFLSLASSLNQQSFNGIGSLESLPDYVRMSFACNGILIDLSIVSTEKGGEL